ncbi:hypothetical protein LXL04_007393 [Taraxacum kok-saghyz]
MEVNSGGGPRCSLRTRKGLNFIFAPGLKLAWAGPGRKAAASDKDAQQIAHHRNPIQGPKRLPEFQLASWTDSFAASVVEEAYQFGAFIALIMPPCPDPDADQPPSTQDQLNALIRLSTTANNRFDTLIANMTTQSARMATQHDTLNNVVHLLTALTQHLNRQPDPPPPPPPPPNDQHRPNNNPRPPKILLPTFDGSNPLDWLFQAENYFTYYTIPADQRLALAVFYFTGEALSWYKHLATNNLLGDWQSFTRSLQLRFGPSSYENHQAALFKLRQTGSVTTYQAEFEKISNLVDGLPAAALRDCFISGLGSDIQAELALHRPTSLHETYGLTKLIEDKLAHNRSRFQARYQPNTTLALPKQAAVSPSTASVQTPASPLLAIPPKSATPLPFNRLSPDALQKRRAEGLYFRCPEKYHPGHKCSPPQFLLIADNEDSPSDPPGDDFALLDDHPFPDSAQPDHNPTYFALSTAAFLGVDSPRALRITGANLVLGMAWLQTLGLVLADFAVPQMTFQFNNRQILLRGEPTSKPTTAAQLSSMLRQESIAECFTVTTAPQPKSIMTKLIHEMLRDGLITPNHSPYSSPVLLVRKKDGTWRFCVDYRGLNAITIRDRFPIPTVDELLDELHGACVFSKIDLRAGYHQIRVAPSDTHKTAFRTIDGHYEFLRMPFGLSNAPSTFQAAMNDIFQDVLRKFVLVFFDDILIYSPSLDLHYQHLRHVFSTLAAHQYHAKYSKCTFAIPEIPYLGYIISAAGVRAEPDKLESIQNWPAPTSITTLRAFLGLTGYYRQFASSAFTSLKTAMSSLLQLALPDFSKSFDVTTDASGTAISAVLSQHDKPISFFSKKLNTTMKNASTYVRELYAITEAVKKWRQYLLGRPFRIYTDQRSLKHLLTQIVQTPEQQKWATKLLGYDFEIFYKPGKENHVADALSRLEQPALLALSASDAIWLQQIRSFFSTNPACTALFQELQDPTAGNRSFTVRDGLLYTDNRLFIPDIPGLRKKLLFEFHSTPVGGHAGVTTTLKRLTSAFFWPNMKQDTLTYVKECATCQSVKYPTRKPYGLLQTLPVPTDVWNDISMDFITHLPPSQGKTAIWVIVDRFTKFAHFIPLPPNYTAVSLATLFLHEIYRLHGIPRSIVFDRDPLFLSDFWKELFKQLGTRLLHSTAYHPQTDGQTEVVNRCLQEFWYNTSYHSGIETPFQALYGRPVPTIHHYSNGQSTVASINTTLEEHQRLRQLLQQTLTRTRQRMTDIANRKRLDKHFNVGDLVYLKLHNYRQHSVAHRDSKKLSKRYFGPFPIVERIGAVAYRLALPPHSKIHPVFHVSLLKQAFGDHPIATAPLPSLLDHTSKPFIPASIIQQRATSAGQIEVLIRWKDHPLEEATWENSTDLQQQFPDFPISNTPELEDELVSAPGGIDTSPANSPPQEPNSRPKRVTRIPARLLD